MSDDELAIRGLVETWLAASQLGDVQKVLTLMADDVVFMVPGREPFGKAEFAARAQKMKDVRMQVISDIKELNIFRDWAWLRTHLTVTTTPSSEPSSRRSGYTLTILRKKADGAWVIARDANLLTAG